MPIITLSTMKKIISVSAIIMIILMALAFKAANDFLQTLGITEEDAHDYVWTSFQDGSLNYPYSESYKSLAASTRIALVKEIGAFAKVYTKTTGFQNKYNDYRESRKPEKPEPPQSMDEMRKQYKEEIEKNVAEIEAQLSGLTGDSKTYMETAIKTMKDQLKQLDDPDNPMFSKEMEAQQQQYFEGQLAQYQKEISDWEQEYPESPVSMIRERLAYFLQVSGDVDFSAKLTKNQYGNMVFVNPDYENKSPDWKMIYRAGKESTGAARDFARQWLDELK